MELDTYVINLPRSEDRRRRMAEQLDRLGLAYTLFPAVDGKARWDELAPTVDMPAFDRNTGRGVLPGEIGAYHSHLEVWRAFGATGRSVALVLEDDVVFHDDFLAALNAALSARGRWDLLKLNHIRAKQAVRVGTAGGWNLNAYHGPFTGFGGYLITRELARRLAVEMLPIRRPIDREADRVHIYRFLHLGLEPYPSHVEDHGQSTITGTNFAAVKKRPWYRRIPSYCDRLSTLIGKARYLRQIKPPL